MKKQEKEKKEKGLNKTIKEGHITRQNMSSGCP